MAADYRTFLAGLATRNGTPHKEEDGSPGVVFA